MNTPELQLRLTNFSKSVIAVCRLLPKDTVSRPLIGQLVRSATSVGANYMEACSASSERDFTHKLFICKKEAQETKYWIELLRDAFPETAHELESIKLECHELLLIFQSSTKTMRQKMKIEK